MLEVLEGMRHVQMVVDCMLYVLEVLERMAGKRYDAAAVKALTTLVKRGTIVVKSLRAPASFTRRRILPELV